LFLRTKYSSLNYNLLLLTKLFRCSKHMMSTHDLMSPQCMFWGMTRCAMISVHLYSVQNMASCFVRSFSWMCASVILMGDFNFLKLCNVLINICEWMLWKYVTLMIIIMPTFSFVVYCSLPSWRIWRISSAVLKTYRMD
jgi:hypothetical protein